VKHLWNKGPAIWFPPLGRARCEADYAKQRPAFVYWTETIRRDRLRLGL